MGIMKPQFAGTWYPGQKTECLRTIERFESDLSFTKVPEDIQLSEHFSGGIVPHAGWYFSGKTAFSAYRSIERIASVSRPVPDLFFLFGMHLPPGGLNCIFIDDGFETPLGTIEVNSLAAEMLAGDFNFIRENSRNSGMDNTIELQLPFIKYLFPDAKIVTVGVSPDDRAIMIGERAYMIAKELGSIPCFIGSTDLTHYGPNYGFTTHGVGAESVRWVREENDKKIIDAFVTVDPQEVLRLGPRLHNACCSGAAAAAIAAVRKGGVRKGYLVQYTTSYDIHPDSSFVGYAGVIF
jgi:AmmeMemoRadiSam system protein B